MFLNKFGIGLIIVIALFSIVSAQTETSDISAKVDEYMNAFVKVKGVGGAVLVARDGKILTAKGYGLANAESNISNTDTTRFRIGSLTKQITAAAVMLLQERGKLNVKDTACKYLENCPDAWKEITIHQLLTHTSGIANYTALPDWKTKKSEDLSPIQVSALIRDLPLKFKSGEDFDYSNTNYLLLGLIIEKVSGKSYETFLQENIFSPLKMNDSGYDHGEQNLPNQAVGYFKKGEQNVRADQINMKAPFAAGAIYSTVEDLFKWQQAFDSETLLKQDTINVVFTPEKKNYGYGWGIGNWKNHKVLSHSGGIDGFSSHIMKFPQEKATVIVLLNNDRVLAQTVAVDLSSILYGEKYDLPKERKEIAVDAKILDSYVGQYEVAPGLAFFIAKEGDKLTFLPPGQPKAVELFAESETDFFLKVVDAQITFVKNESGEVTGLKFQQMGRTTNAKKIK
ncbi:MAG TPA: serine hydrolase [Pyrinomonadaceae bacterium]|nr:serine hydrolase [Pyrinomonadaceae bacterium]